MALDILIVDDERDIRELVAGVLSDEGYECRTAGDSTTALAAVDERRPSLVLLDVWLHGSPMDGLEVLDEIKKREPELPVIIFSGHGNIDTAVSAVSMMGRKRTKAMTGGAMPAVSAQATQSSTSQLRVIMVSQRDFTGSRMEDTPAMWLASLVAPTKTT